MANHLSDSSSPYLLQHANNPVDWYPWGSEALEKARREDKPIFLSIGYAACHWCHVMAHESFEDPSIAALMNLHFVSIKVDREERPDLDGIYMSFVVALTGQGGWPMSIFLAPDGKPFYGGTYFPPTPQHNLPAFREVLEAVSRLWNEDRQRLLAGSDELIARLKAPAAQNSSQETVDANLLRGLTRSLTAGYDWQNGGWGGAPKFPQPMLVEFLLRQGSRGDQPATDLATHALVSMAKGGMYDVLGGGFARYSVDPTWLVPHFEKMLYDNAQLACVYLHAYLLTGMQALREVCEATLDFTLREMTHPLGGFYSSLDADSEGEEGKYYLWTEEEIRQALAGEGEMELFTEAYGISEGGNFEGKNILRRMQSDEQLAARFQTDTDVIHEQLSAMRNRLLDLRSSRVRPATDDKVLTSWNALMLSALAQAGSALDRADYLHAAVKNASFTLKHMLIGDRLRRSWRDGKAGQPAFLEDYASTALAMLSLYQANPDPRWYDAASQLMSQVLDHFSDPEGGFFDTADDHESLLYRPKEVQDNATPSGNALAAHALLLLAAFEGRTDWHARAETMIKANLDLMKRYPAAFGQWLVAADTLVGPLQEVAIVGALDDPGTLDLLRPLRGAYRPRLVLAATAYPPGSGSPGLLNDRPLKNGKPTAYVCHDFICQLPVNTTKEMLEQLGWEKKTP